MNRIRTVQTNITPFCPDVFLNATAERKTDKFNQKKWMYYVLLIEKDRYKVMSQRRVIRVSEMFVEHWSSDATRPACRSMRPLYSPHAVPQGWFLIASPEWQHSWTDRLFCRAAFCRCVWLGATLSARRSAPWVHLATTVGHQGSMMIPLVPVIMSQNAYIPYLRALRFGDPVQGTAACRYERQAAQSRRRSSTQGLLCLLCAIQLPEKEA